jgi:hypothetical protein
VVTPQAYFHFKHFPVIIKSNYDIAKNSLDQELKDHIFISDPATDFNEVVLGK